MSAYGSGLCSVYIFLDLFTHFIVRQMKIENPIALNSNSTPLLKKPHNSWSLSCLQGYVAKFTLRFRDLNNNDSDLESKHD